MKQLLDTGQTGITAAGPLRTAKRRVVDPQAVCRQAQAAGLIVHRADPLNAETPLSALAAAAVVPNERFYVRNHFAIPALDPRTWRLRVGGLAARPLSLSLAELRSMASQTVVATLECTGNGRSWLQPPVPGEQWGLGAAGTAAWTGVPLTKVLDLAVPRLDAQEVVSRGADQGLIEGRNEPVNFGRSLSLSYLSTAEAMLAYAMNGQPLPVAHGYPLRLVVPDWYGVASVKWLAEIKLTGRAFGGHSRTRQRHYPGQGRRLDQGRGPSRTLAERGGAEGG